MIRPSDQLADVLAADEARVAALEVFAHDHPARVGGVFLCTSATRPSSPAEGFTIYETDTNLYRYWNGSAWVTLLDPATSGLLGGIYLCTSATRPSAPTEGVTVYETDTNLYLYWNGTAWVTVLDPAASRVYTVKGTATQVNSSNTSLNDITGLSFAVVSGQMYHFRFMGRYSSAATTTGIGFAFSGPAVTYCSWEARIQQAAAGTAQMFTDTTNALATVIVSASVVTANVSYAWSLEGFVQPSASGTLQARFRSEINLSAVTLIAGSIGILTRVA